MKNVKTTVVSLMLMLGLIAAPIALGSVSYAAGRQDACSGINAIGGGNACATNPDGTPNATANELGGTIKDIINLLLMIIGIIAVIMIIIGGIRYTTSGGDSNQVNGAKNTILYAIVGLVVAIMAFAIVNFVLGRL